ESGVLADPNSKTGWDTLAKSVRWIIQTILAALIGIAIQNGYDYIKASASQSPHERKAEVRQLKHEAASSPTIERLPFVNRDYLAVRERPRHKSSATGYVFYPQTVNIIKASKRKTWLLIEWQEEGEIRRGWTLGRYIFRWPGQGCPEKKSP
ncbi:hypothetical protein LCGC14_2225860, partial [marine sediment metagenome]